MLEGGSRGWRGLVTPFLSRWPWFRQARVSGRNLLWCYLLVINLNLVVNVLLESGWYGPAWWPVTLWYGLNTYLLLGPMLYLLGCRLAGYSPWRWRHIALHASPFVLGVAYHLGATDFNLYGWELSRQSELGVVDRFNPLALFTATHFSIYLAATGWVGANLWASQRKRWSRELWLLISVVSLSLGMMVSILVATVWALVLQMEKSIGLIAGGTLGVFVMEVWVVWLLWGDGEPSVAQSSSESKAAETLALGLQGYLNDKKPFLDPEWSASTLASQLGITRHQLSAAIALIEPEGFYALANRLRVEEVCRRIEAMSNQHLIQIAYDCGFNSKSTFNQAFKKITGMTPSRFRAGVSEAP